MMLCSFSAFSAVNCLVHLRIAGKKAKAVKEDYLVYCSAHQINTACTGILIMATHK
jgi:hypothetical protein